MTVSNEVPVWAVIPAAGSGHRMQSDIPKQYLQFQGKSILEHCLDRLLTSPRIDGAILVLAEDDNRWDALEYQAEKPLFIATGGSERHHSVYNGLMTLQYRQGNDALVAVHDAVRPLLRHDDLDRLIEAARGHEAGAVLALPLADTLKKAGECGGVDQTLNRQGLWRALTPQVFFLPTLLNALQRVIDARQDITDDASAIELAGYSPLLIEGSADNLKITRPDDLVLAEHIWLHQRDQNNNK